MRIWDIHPSMLCRKHLLGEHRELHAIWSVLVNGKKGYSKHPETLRWVGKLMALYRRHDAQVREMKRRGWNHLSPLDKSKAEGTSIVQDFYVDFPDAQARILQEKGCECKVWPQNCGFASKSELIGATNA